ncbi:MAG: bifunctional [glutamine synthetase] adenylyltransferase/[glutamine synthetase]-adenylyl-L-tyrosine phosphorylase [Nitriliruptorales bacterium]|nr:bifunctional [glutamine synthetase] adenylyltransferase/[glutamine synthetase]-adenylyl-L-tyrosine phosphorylase [Nitriliruptorales bacterium]
MASVRGRLAAAGLDVDRAERRLASADLLDPLDDELLGLVADTAAPDDALATVCDLATNHREAWSATRQDKALLRRVLNVAGASRPLGDLLARHPDAITALQRTEPLTVRAVADPIRAAVSASTDHEEQAANVATIRRRATAWIAANDLTDNVDVQHVAQQLSIAAEGVLTGTLEALLDQLDEPVAARIGVIGMGKLGGRELNYVSDVDVIFVHAPADGAAEDEATRQATLVLENLLRILNASTTMGRAYEIDPTLRPEGRHGALTRQVGSYVNYWERWAKTWEFQALLKARPVAGDLELGRELIRASEPFVWREDLDPDVVAEIRDMKGRVEGKPEVRKHGARQVKLGPGGIRDIEFAVQLLQLVHGRADGTLRVTATVPALEALAAGGYVAEDDAVTFINAYRTLRTIEHRLQLANERRTHTIPDDDDKQERLARSLGYRASPDSPARAEFLRDLAALQGRVRELHAKLFYRPLLETHAIVPASAGAVANPSARRQMGDEDAAERLRLLGFRDGPAALRHVQALTKGVSREARVLRAVLPAILHVLAASPDPDGGLRLLRDLVESHGSSADLLNLLRDQPPAAELLARLLGTSPVAGELLIAQPQGTDWLVDPAVRADARTREELVELALARLHWQDRNDAVRRFKRHELLRIVVRDLDGQAPVSLVGQELAALGDACLEVALAGELEVLADESGVEGPDTLPFSFAVLGMGKLGGRELHYASDLDVLFVHEPAEGADPDAATAMALTLAERMLAALGQITAEGTAFEVDADLRPEGRSGPLSRTLSSYRAYWDRWSEPWEHQSLIKVRHAAGDAELAERFMAEAGRLAFPDDLSEERVTIIRRLKARVEKERIRRKVDPRRHLKLGPGGISDVEWTVQLLQQRHGASRPALRVTSTQVALDALQDESLLEHRDATWLRDGYRFLSRIRNHLYLLRVRNVDLLPTDATTLERLARGMGYGRNGRQKLEDDYLRVTRRVRRVCERVFYEVEPADPFGRSAD